MFAVRSLQRCPLEHPDPSPDVTGTGTQVTGSSVTPVPPPGEHGDGVLGYEVRGGWLGYAVGGGQLGHEMTVWHPAMNSVTTSRPNPLIMLLPLGTRRTVCITPPCELI